MQVQNSSFQKISIGISLFFLFLSLTQCRADTVWGLPADRLQQQLHDGQREFLRELRVEEKNLAEAFRLGPGAPFYLAQLFISLNREQTADQLLALQWRRGDSPWREEAALLLIRRFIKEDSYAEAESLAGRLLRRVREPEIEAAAGRLLLEALYWQEKDEELLAALEQGRGREAPWDDELDLFRAVSSQRLAKPGWPELFVDLFFHKRSSGLHVRAYAYLEQEDRLAAFAPAASRFFQGKSLLYRGQNTEAIALIEASLADLDVERPDMDIVIQELGAAYLADAQYAAGAETLLGLSVYLSPSQRLAAVEMAGRLYHKGGMSVRAEQLLSEVLRDAASPRQRDRAIWFLLDLAGDRSSGELLETLAELAPSWADPEYFEDILDAEIARLVARRDWIGLHSLYRALTGYGPAAAMARLAYLSGRVITLGLLDSSVTSFSPQALFLEARGSEVEYYRFLAETALTDLGIPPQWSLEPAGVGGGTSLPRREDGFPESAATVLRGYFDYGLYETGAGLLSSNWRRVSPELLLESAVTLQGRREYLHSLRLLNLYSLRKQGALERSELELLYPQAYGGWIGEISESEGIPAPLFFALVREESYFDPRIVSRSGAVGLTQLMEETAADSARWLRIQEYDLRDPEQNLRLGARHFSRLLARLEDIPKALMAYNAGLSRLRGWERSFAGLPADLLAEAAPYPETRNYVRKILVSAVYYGALYYERPVERSVLLFYPGLEQ